MIHNFERREKKYFAGITYHLFSGIVSLIFQPLEIHLNDSAWCSVAR
ncbi:MAG: hypothetical protein ACXWV6_11725 [Chitinophagaceae bacterium]